MREEIIQTVDKEKIIAIVRGVSPDKIHCVAKALYSGGIRLMEVTFDQANPDKFIDTCNAISAIAKEFGRKMYVGAGTVTSPKLVDMAHEAGALFIVSPDCNPSVIRRTRELGMVSMPGAMTPTEILAAHEAGADYIKLFPVGNLGASYVKAVCAPISHLKMLAVGGVNATNVKDFLDAGCCGAGIGGNLANKKWIAAGEFDKITEVAKEICASIGH